MAFVKQTGVDTITKSKMNKILQAIILSILLITGFVINAGYVVNVQADNEEFEINVSAETAEEWTETGIGFGKSGQYEKAIECFSKAIDLDANYAKAYNGRGIAYKNLKEYERAICDYNKAIELNVNYTKAYNNRGHAYYDLKEYERAIEDYNKAIDLNVNYTKAYNNRGYAYYDLKEYERAIEDYNKAIDLDATHTHAYNNRGLAYVRSGHYERAKEDFEKVIELNQAPEILEKEVSEQNYNISMDCSLNYDIFLNNSARATIYLEITNSNENSLSLGHIYLKVEEVPGKITNVKVEAPRRKRFINSSCPCSSRPECFQNLNPREYCYNETKASNTTRYGCFCVAIDRTLGSHKLTNLYISYSISNITDRSKGNIKYLHIPPERFDNFWVRLPKYDYLFRWDSALGNDSEILKFLWVGLDIGWAENAEIHKSNDGKTIRISKNGNVADIKIDEKKEEATLKIPSDGRSYYLKKKDDMLYTYKPLDARLRVKSYNILINLPQDRYHYSQLRTLPHPYPDVTSLRGSSPTLSWQFTPKERDFTRLIIPSYKIKYDKYMITLDALGFLAIFLAFFSISLTLINVHKWGRLRIIVALVFMLVFGSMVIYVYSYMIGRDNVVSLIETVLNMLTELRHNTIESLREFVTDPLINISQEILSQFFDVTDSFFNNLYEQQQKLASLFFI